jgi:hypothetical protein
MSVHPEGAFVSFIRHDDQVWEGTVIGPPDSEGRVPVQTGNIPEPLLVDPERIRVVSPA